MSSCDPPLPTQVFSVFGFKGFNSSNTIRRIWALWNPVWLYSNIWVSSSLIRSFQNKTTFEKTSFTQLCPRPVSPCLLLPLVFSSPRRVLLLQHVRAQGAAEAEGVRGPGAPVRLHHHAQLQQPAPPQGQRQRWVPRWEGTEETAGGLVTTSSSVMAIDTDGANWINIAHGPV